MRLPRLQNTSGGWSGDPPSSEDDDEAVAEADSDVRDAPGDPRREDEADVADGCMILKRDGKGGL